MSIDRILRSAWLVAAVASLMAPARPAYSAQNENASQPATRNAPPATAAAPETPSTSPTFRAPERPIVTPMTPAPRDHDDEPITIGHESEFWPSISGPLLYWFAAVFILVLTMHLRPMLSARNLDGLVLAATALVLAVRRNEEPVLGLNTTITWQSASYILLTAAAVYWLLRGVRFVSSRNVPRFLENVKPGAMVVLVIAGLCIAFGHIFTSPISRTSADATAGGLYVLETGKLPYGDVSGHDSHSPLLYLVHAGALKVLPAESSEPGESQHFVMNWNNHETWMHGDWWEYAELNAPRAVNALLLALLILAVYLLGARLHSAAVGLTMVAILCVFPGALDSFGQPGIMLAAVLLTLSVLLSLMGGAAMLLSALLLVLCATVWPWAWLILPVLLGFALRRAGAGAAALLGVIAGLALVGFGLMNLVRPTVPSVDRALRVANEPATTIISHENGGWRIEPRPANEPAARAVTAPLWKALVDADPTTLDPQSLDQDAGRHAASAPGSLLYRQLEPTLAAREPLQRSYRNAVALQSPAVRALAAIRTVLEATWLAPRPEGAPAGAWGYWGEDDPARRATWVNIRRVVKVLATLMCLALGVLLLRGWQVLRHQFVGGVLVATAFGLIASGEGPVANMAWLLPIVLATFALHHQDPPGTRPPARPGAGGPQPLPRAATAAAAAPVPNPASPSTPSWGRPPSQQAAAAQPIEAGAAPRISVEE